MNKIFISPYSRKLKSGKINAKNFPYWREVVEGLHKEGYQIVQVGQSGQGEEPIGSDNMLFNTNLHELEEIVKRDCLTWISVDNFFHHLCAFINKPGVVIFGKSHPEIWGYPINKNLLKDRKYLRPDAYGFWEEVEHNPEVFVEPQVVIDAVKEMIEKNSIVEKFPQ